jgi:hypothetical protein
VINLGVLVALVAAVLLSLLDVIRRMAWPNDAILGWSSAELRYADVSSYPDVAVSGCGRVSVLRPAVLRQHALLQTPVWAAVDAAPKPTRHMVLDMAVVPGVDSTRRPDSGSCTTGCWRAMSVWKSRGATDSLETAMDRLGNGDLRLGSIGTKGRLRCAASLSISEDV